MCQPMLKLCMCTGLGKEHMCRREINSLIWGFLFVYMINTAPVTREILSVQLKTASLVENSRFGSVSCPLHFAGTEMCWFWSDGEKFTQCHLWDWKVSGEGRFPQAQEGVWSLS